MSETTIPAAASPDAQPRRYKLGVALSGGGARGFAHVGALKALEEAGLKPDINCRGIGRFGSRGHVCRRGAA